MKLTTASLLTCFILLNLSCSKKRYADALTPEEALKSFQLDNNFNIEVFAAEPFVLDPVDMIFDEEGKIYLVEMPDYPYRPEPGKGKGSIKVLTDENSDGRIDKATIFAENLSEATSVLPWKGGLLVAAAPNIYYMKDTTGDLKADVKEVLFTGFFDKNSEAQITNLKFGVDNWIYASNHGQDGNVTFKNKPDAPALSMKNADFRFRLDKNKFELETGPGQFGHTFDDFGHRFVSENTIRIQHMVMPWRYMHRHEYLPSKKGVTDISNKDLTMYQLTPAPYWRAERTARRNKDYQEQKLDRVEYADKHFTGASGATYYGGQSFPEKYYGNVFIGDVAGNLIHRDILTALDSSPTYSALRDSVGEPEKEFLASTDPWFRPANFTVGPDGALYVIDFYRQHIETPVSIPEDLKTDMDFMAGMDKGRIYKITPKNPRSKENIKPSERTSADYVKLLSNENQWWRLQAQRLLLERQDQSVVPAVKSLFLQSADPKVRLHAFFVLEGLGALDAELTRKAIHDATPGVREYGLILAEQYPQLLAEIINKTADSSARVAFQATLSLGQFPSEKSTAAMLYVIEKHYRDPWFRKAVLSSNTGSSNAFFKLLVEKGTFFTNSNKEKVTFLEDFSYIIAARNAKGEIVNLLKTLSNSTVLKVPDWQVASLTGIAEGFKQSKEKPERDPELAKVLNTLNTNSDPKVKEAIREITSVWD